MKELDKLQHLPKDISDIQDFNGYYYPAREYMEDSDIIADFLEKQKTTLKDILCVTVFVDKDISDDEKYILPPRLQAVLHYAERGCIKFYILHHLHEGVDYYKAIVGGFGGTTMRTNEYLMEKILENVKIKSITRKQTLSLKKLYEESIDS